MSDVNLDTERRRHWQRRLGRIRLGAEPVEWQLARYRRTTWVLTFVPLGIAAIIFAILTAFGAPLLGLLVDAVLFGPIIGLAWFDFLKMQHAVREYLQEARGANP